MTTLLTDDPQSACLIGDTSAYAIVHELNDGDDTDVTYFITPSITSSDNQNNVGGIESDTTTYFLTSSSSVTGCELVGNETEILVEGVEYFTSSTNSLNEGGERADEDYFISSDALALDEQIICSDNHHGGIYSEENSPAAVTDGSDGGDHSVVYGLSETGIGEQYPVMSTSVDGMCASTCVDGLDVGDHPVMYSIKNLSSVDGLVIVKPFSHSSNCDGAEQVKLYTSTF